MHPHAFTPIPMMSPLVFNHHVPSQTSTEPPARVKVALEFLAHLTLKTMPRVAINDLQIQEIDGQRLTAHEQTAQMTACEVLCDYFRGKLPVSRWEKPIVSEENSPPRGSNIINCPACMPGPARPSCYLCRGVGSVAVYPTASS